MSPPAIICSVIRPEFISRIMEQEKAVIWTFFTYICSLRIVRLRLIDTFSVHPFVKRATMIEYTIQNHTHSTLMHLFYQFDKQLITCLKIADISCALLILCRMDIILCTCRKYFSVIHNNLSIMRIYVIIILNIILMIRRRNKQRIEVNNFNSKILQIIQLI